MHIVPEAFLDVALGESPFWQVGAVRPLGELLFRPWCQPQRVVVSHRPQCTTQ
jgi:hypothetical protein